MSPTCCDMSATTQRVAPIVARWVRVADTKLKMLWQFVSARADIYQIFRSAYVEIYYGMGVNTHRYYRTSQRSFLSCSPFCPCSPHETKITTTLLNTTTNTTAHHVRQHHPPMPPTKAMGAITQNRRGRPTTTP
jgi:hypothetical protein